MPYRKCEEFVSSYFFCGHIRLKMAVGIRLQAAPVSAGCGWQENELPASPGRANLPWLRHTWSLFSLLPQQAHCQAQAFCLLPCASLH
jgi:hypothetical protein